jgi:CRP-like cAMP-binding protein
MLWNCCSIPYLLAFYTKEEGGFGGLRVAEACIQVVFVMDVAVQVIRTRLQQDYPSRSTKGYLGSWMLPDVLACLPLQVAQAEFRVLGLPKLWRLTRMCCTVPTRGPECMRWFIPLSALTLTFALLLHWITCAGCALDLSYGWTEPGAPAMGLLDPFASGLYAQCLRTSLLLATLQDPGLPAPEQIYFAAGVYVVVLLFYLCSVSFTVMATNTLGFAGMRRRRKEILIEDELRELKLPAPFAAKIRAYFKYMAHEHASSFLGKSFRGSLSSSLLMELRRCIYYETLGKVELFQNAPAGFLSSMADHVTVEFALTGESICKADDPADCINVVAKGVCELYYANSTQRVVPLLPGDLCGEESLWVNARCSTVHATSTVMPSQTPSLFDHHLHYHHHHDYDYDYDYHHHQVELLKITRDAFREVLALYSPFENKIYTSIRASECMDLSPGLMAQLRLSVTQRRREMISKNDNQQQTPTSPTHGSPKSQYPFGWSLDPERRSLELRSRGKKPGAMGSPPLLERRSVRLSAKNPLNVPQVNVQQSPKQSQTARGSVSPSGPGIKSLWKRLNNKGDSFRNNDNLSGDLQVGVLLSHYCDTFLTPF